MVRPVLSRILCLVAGSVALACALEPEGTASSSVDGGGGLGGTGGGAGDGGVECFQGAKVCPGANGDPVCIPTNNPDTGCAKSSCEPCALANAAAKCGPNGGCVIDQCQPGFADCDGQSITGCEAKLDSEPTHCGSCATNCVARHGSNWTCEQGQCVVTSCVPATTADCNGDKTDGCEIDLLTDADNCGTCGQACALPHAISQCQAGQCVIVSCIAPYADCDGDPATGCEVNTATDPASCGGCGTTCGSINGTPGCVNGGCVILCTAPWANCDGTLANGCETNRSTNVANCGACGNACNSNNGQASCSSGSCSIACSVPFANCDGLLANGCEANLTSSTSHCGGCGLSCSSVNGTASCSSGACSILCNGGFANCDANIANGCEANLATNVNHCSGCGVVCSSQNIPTRTCSGGVCSGNCAAGFADCNGNKQTDGCEANISTNVDRCGGCSVVCSDNNIPLRTCTAGACTGVCAPGFADCNGNKQTDGCEANISSNVDRCGGCNVVCSSNNVPVRACAGGVCTGLCATGFADCDGNKQTNGCEINSDTNVNHCGGCGVVCSASNIPVRTCAGGVCAGACASGFDDCDGNKQTNGCETNVQTNVEHCGACNAPCASGESCANGVCVP